MKNMEIPVKKATLIVICVFLSSFLSVMADGVQESLNLDYFRTPEASAFKIYGEESVNEYTGTADISVPLYTIKCKDIEIPIVLRYNASGIKVEQEASWVGLGWNLMVGGCINYVCAGALDQHMDCSSISTRTWTEYLTNMKTPNPNGTQYFHYSTDNIDTWMETVNHSFAFDPPYSENLSQEMQNYLMWGYGERDFYSVNVLGKSFKFFIDPATLICHIIGEAGEDFRIEPECTSDNTGIGNPINVLKWTITDSNGYAYVFENADVLADNEGHSYKSCWYLTDIHTPQGGNVELSYTPHREWERSRRIESYDWLSSSVSNEDMGYHPKRYASSTHAGRVVNSYLKEIKTSNQTISFVTAECNESSGRKLDSITVKSNFKDKPIIKTIKFSYSSFGYSNVGGSYAPANNETYSEYRLKLDNVKEIASTDTLTTCFFYNPLDLPSKRSCAQDFWGYYNGQENISNTSSNHHTLIPTPTNFMTKNYNIELGNIRGANRYSNGDYMQAAMLNKVVYPTGGYTTYEYEPHCFAVNDYTQSLEYQEFMNRPYDADIYKSFSYTPYNSLDSFIVYNDPYDFTLDEELAFSLYVRCNGDVINGQEIQIIIAPIGSALSSILIPVTYMSSNDSTIVLQDTLPAGNYQLLIGAPSNNVHQGYAIGCWLKGYYTSASFFNSYSQEIYTQIGGGLRIRKVNNYNNDNSLINYVTYDYNNDGGTTGILLNEIETIETFSYTYLKKEPNNYEPPTVYSRHPISGWTINTGQTRFPAFFESCNPGNVGYSHVTKHKYDANGNLEKSVVTSYINKVPKSMTFMDYYDCLDNGKVLSQKIFDSNGGTISKVENEYRYHERYDDEERDKWYSTNMLARDKLVIDRELYVDEAALQHRFLIWKYPYILSRVELSQSTTTEYYPDSSTVVKTKDYLYNGINHQVSQIDENTGLPNQIRRTKLTYSADGTDSISRAMKNVHMLNDVVETKNILVENGLEKRISTQHTTYAGHWVNDTTYYLPCSNSTSIGSNALETRATYSYDDKRNVCSIAVDSIETVYIWSYKGHYPIAKIEGLTYAEVQNAVGTSTISNLLDKEEPTVEDISSIRNAIRLAGGLVTTYTFKPLVGIESQTMPNGNTIYYEYDSFGRLSRVVDHNGSTVSTNSYNYRKP